MKMSTLVPLLAVLSLLVSCGPALQEGMVRVPAGEFHMGCNAARDANCDPDEKPGHKVYLDAYQVDVHEVTAAEYQACMDAGGCKKPVANGDCNVGKAGRGDHPANCVSWYQAKNYCEWAGKTLPTEAQWEKAARGTDGRVYPWGDAKPDCTGAAMGEGGPGCGTGTTLPVCSKPKGKSPYGACDMSGNVMEWVYDPQDPSWYGRSPKENPVNQGGKKMNKALRGGERGFTILRFLRTSNRDGLKPQFSNYGIGFRCVYEEK